MVFMKVKINGTIYVKLLELRCIAFTATSYALIDFIHMFFYKYPLGLCSNTPVHWIKQQDDVVFKPFHLSSIMTKAIDLINILHYFNVSGICF